MFKDSKKKAGVVKPDSMAEALALCQALVEDGITAMNGNPSIAAKYASISYTPRGWVGVNRNTGGEELLPAKAFLLRPLSDLVND